MQRPTTSGRRHNRAGSVTVAELIRKQPATVPTRYRDRAGAHEPPAGPPREDRAPNPTGGRPARTAKLAGVATGAIVLLAWVTAAAVLAGNRPAGPVQPRVEPPESISGSSALRPDLLAAQLGGGPVEPPAPAERQAAALGDDVTPQSPVMVPPPQVDVGPQPQVDIVRRFFALLPARPAEAARLLSPELLGGSPHDFVESWAGVQAITVESTSPRSGGEVLAVVSMQERSGRWIRVEQLFRLTETSVPRIVATEVLSAQQN
ncbi:hypothetical protein ACIGNX_08750 [Actinosynnema sp. NPDC053489]|uniref:hypothetical protein n=1 Tax=Actinosynnema sp. NPDC053489 TaxID=3363916 RepID=UPI0037C593FB